MPVVSHDQREALSLHETTDEARDPDEEATMDPEPRPPRLQTGARCAV
jgi:hypothetical protein